MGFKRFWPRWLHRLYARHFGYFWMPCKYCGRPFGGHEVTKRYAFRAIEVGGAGAYWTPCPECGKDPHLKLLSG